MQLCCANITLLIQKCAKLALQNIKKHTMRIDILVALKYRTNTELFETRIIFR